MKERTVTVKIVQAKTNETKYQKEETFVVAFSHFQRSHFYGYCEYIFT